MAEFRYETERLILRDWREEDWPAFFEYTNTPAVMEWLGGVMDSDKQAWQRDRLEGYAHDHGFTFWAVERPVDSGHLAGELLGFCGLKRSNQEGGPQGDHEIGWRLREDAWGHGYAKEAAVATLKLAFERFHAPHVLSLTIAQNAASWGLMERLGMERRADLDFANDEYGADTIIAYCIAHDQWQRLQEPSP